MSTIIDGGPKGKILSMDGVADHYRLWAREQQFPLNSIREDRGLSQHVEDAVRSLNIVLQPIFLCVRIGQSTSHELFTIEADRISNIYWNELRSIQLQPLN